MVTKILLSTKNNHALLRRCLWAIASHCKEVCLTIAADNQLNNDTHILLGLFASRFECHWLPPQAGGPGDPPFFRMDESVIILADTFEKLEATPGSVVEADLYRIRPEALDRLDDFGANIDGRFVENCLKDPIPFSSVHPLILVRWGGGQPVRSDAVCLVQDEGVVDENSGVHPFAEQGLSASRLADESAF